ncbi:MAG: SRPBCC domain-containing protein [Undibacterium sp.]|nr:SRPBCC domain-containing protein [Opitutaceae bacterium]
MVTFTEHAGKTTVSIHSTAFNAPAAQQRSFDDNHESMRQGWGGTWDQLETHLGKPKRPCDDEFREGRVRERPHRS